MLSLLFKSRYATPNEATTRDNDLVAKMTALDKSLATIEFQPDGTIINANANFLQAVGYSLDEIEGRHHSMFVDKKTKESGEYQQFWARLNRGEFIQDEFKRIGNHGKEIWIQATYNPLLNSQNHVYKVIKFATDITAQKNIDADYTGQIAAINKSLAVIEFDMNGNILTANDNFLATMGYTLSEVKGKHHRIFVDEKYAATNDYRDFWQRLSRGNFESNEFMRLTKQGEEVWIQASYNPILDTNGNPF